MGPYDTHFFNASKTDPLNKPKSGAKRPKKTHYHKEQVSTVKKSFQNKTRSKLYFAKEACCKLFSGPEIHHNTTTNHL